MGAQESRLPPNWREENERGGEIPVYCDKCMSKPDSTWRNAERLCFECEQYLCLQCSDVDHERNTNHLLCSIFELNNSTRSSSSLFAQMYKRVKDEGEMKRENLMRDRLGVVDRISVSDEADTARMCLTNDGRTLVISRVTNWYITLLNISKERSHTVKRRHITFTSYPYGLAQINEEDCNSKSVMAVTFPHKKVLLLLDVGTKPARIIQEFRPQGECYDVGYCSGHFAILCSDDKIHILDKTGATVRRIDVSSETPGVMFTHQIVSQQCGSTMALHQDTNTIYVIHGQNKIKSFKMKGEITSETDLPIDQLHGICVDSTQNVYAARLFPRFKLYKLSADLTEHKEIRHDSFNGINQALEMTMYKDRLYLYQCQNVLEPYVVVYRHE